MARKLIKLFTLVLLATVSVLPIDKSESPIYARDCIDDFGDAVKECNTLYYNEACYGRRSVAREFRDRVSPSSLANDFSTPGHQLEISNFDTVNTSGDGVVVMVLDTPDAPVKLVFYGDAEGSLEATSSSDSMAADYEVYDLETDSEVSCEDSPSGLLAQTKNGQGHVIVNGVLIRLASTAHIMTDGVVVCSGTPPTRLAPGMSARIAYTDGTPTRLRAEPDGEILFLMPEGENYGLDIIGGPRCSSSGLFTWWNVITEDGLRGWVAEGDNRRYYVEPVPGSTAAKWMSVTNLEGSVSVSTLTGAPVTVPVGSQAPIDLSGPTPRIFAPIQGRPDVIRSGAISRMRVDLASNTVGIPGPD